MCVCVSARQLHAACRSSRSRLWVRRSAQACTATASSVPRQTTIRMNAASTMSHNTPVHVHLRTLKAWYQGSTRAQVTAARFHTANKLCCLVFKHVRTVAWSYFAACGTHSTSHMTADYCIGVTWHTARQCLQFRRSATIGCGKASAWLYRCRIVVTGILRESASCLGSYCHTNHPSTVQAACGQLYKNCG